jgi:hypothetical protein
MTCVVVLHGEHMGSGRYVVGSERRRKGGSKIRKGDQPPIKCKLGLGLGGGEQSWLTEQEDLRVEGEMSESLFRIQHPLTPQL